MHLLLDRFDAKLTSLCGRACNLPLLDSRRGRMVADRVPASAYRRHRSPSGDPVVLRPFIDRHCTALAHPVAADFGVTFDVCGLASVEVALAHLAALESERGEAFRTAVVKLGCLGGECTRAAHDGYWQLLQQVPVPFGLTVRVADQAAIISVFARAWQRVQTQGRDADSLLSLMLQLDVLARPSAV